MLRWPKLNRAIELRDELLKWSLDSYGRIAHHSRHNLRIVSERVAWVEYSVEPGTLPDAQRGALLLGDMVHNLRAALDHQMWAATPDDVRTGPSASRVQFPIYSDESKWERWKDRWSIQYGLKVLEVLEIAQPCTVPAGSYSSMALLQSLSNQDKHRALNVAAHVSLDGYGFAITPEPDGLKITKHTGPIEDDTILARAEWPRPERGSGEIVVEPTFAYAQRVQVPDVTTAAGGEWHELGDLVNAVVSETVNVVGGLYNADLVDRGLPQDQ